MALLLLTLASGEARADCPAAPIGNPDDMVISFLKTHGVQVASGSMHASTVKEGMLVYDDASDVLKLCDGTNWIEVGTGSGTDTLASLSCAAGEIARFNGSAWACAADGGGGSMQSAVQSAPLNIAQNVTTDVLSFTVATSGAYTILAKGYTSALMPWFYLSSTCWLFLDSTTVHYSPFYYGTHDASTGSSPFFPHVLYHAANLTAGQTVKVSCVVTSDSTTRTVQAWKIDLVPFGGGGGSDTLSGLSCSTGQIPKWSGSAWACANAGGGAGTQVAFSANKNGVDQTGVGWISSTKLTFTNETLDTNNNYDAANSRFTPTVAGNYLVVLTIDCDAAAANQCSPQIKKNTSIVTNPYSGLGDAGHIIGNTAVAIVPMNGSTDYIEAWGGSISGTVRGAASISYFSAALIGGGGSDTLSGMSCTAGQIPKWNGTAWDCAVDGGGSGGGSGIAAWATVNGATGALIAGSNIASVTRTALGRYTITFTNALPDTHYAVVSGATNSGAGDGDWLSVDNAGGGRSAGNVKIATHTAGGGFMDYPEFSIAVLHASAAGGGSATSNVGYVQLAGASNTFVDSGTVAGQQLLWDNTNKRLGIGTTTPRTHLDVNGLVSGGFGSSSTLGVLDWNNSSNARSGNGNTLLLGSASNGPGGAYYFYPFSFEYNAKDGSGNLTQLAVSYADSATTLDNGALFMRGRYEGVWTSWYKFTTASISDYRAKTNLRPMTGALDRVMKMKPVRFEYKKDAGPPGARDGFIADQMQAIAPYSVTGTRDAVDADGKPTYQSMDYGQLTPLLVGAIQQLKADNDNLRSSLKAANVNDAGQDAALEELRREIEILKAAR